MTRLLALLLTALTGFSGLAYQITWQKYLSTLLGSHSEATAAVLGIFLGGLSLGYKLFGVLTRRMAERAAAQGRPPRLLLAYGLLEAGIGIYALLFPALFRGVHALSAALPYGPGAFGFAIDVALVALLIGPATVLMGATIPILTQALSRTVEEATRFHALVYGFNTAGAFAGALGAGFVLVPLLGLVRVMIWMGLVNLFAGAVFAGIGLLRTRTPGLAVESSQRPAVEGYAVYAAIALLVGFAMMVIQTSVIRIAALSFGASQYTFAMVVSIFVLCIALGSFIVSALPSVRPSHIVANQWALAFFVLVLGFVVPFSPYLAYLLRLPFDDSVPAFWLFQFQVLLLLGLLCGPAILCSGASLPLLFHQLRHEKGDLGDVAGSLYSWNTVGSLLGALLGGYALLFWVDLHDVYALALGALLLAAVLLTSRVYALGRPAAVALAATLLLPTLVGPWSPELLSRGLFRAPDLWEGSFSKLWRTLRGGDEILYHQDDPTMTVTVNRTKVGIRTSLSLRTNGKADGDSILDYTTMSMAAILPCLFAEDPKDAFVIGLGTGVTAGELAGFESIESVLVSEISSGVIEAAQLFDSANRGATTSPKVEIVRSDAYRALMRSQRSFDVIVSEPSNPWVSGVENLFSREFLEAAKGRLRPGGVYAQWFHQYEVDDPTLEIVLRTYARVFDHVAIWYMQGPDLLLLGFESAQVTPDIYRLEQRAGRPDYAAALRRAGVEGMPELLAHELLPLGVLHEIPLEGPVQSLYHPRLGYLAGRAFFQRGHVDLPFSGGERALAVSERNSLLGLYRRRFGGTLPEEQRARLVRETCKWKLDKCATLIAQWQVEDPDSEALAEIRRAMEGSDSVSDALPELLWIFDADARRDGPLTAERAEEIETVFVEYFHHAAPFPGEALLEAWGRCRARPPSLEECSRAEAERGVSFDRSREEWIQDCLDSPVVTQECQRGYDRARELLGEG